MDHARLPPGQVTSPHWSSSSSFSSGSHSESSPLDVVVVVASDVKRRCCRSGLSDLRDSTLSSIPAVICLALWLHYIKFILLPSMAGCEPSRDRQTGRNLHLYEPNCSFISIISINDGIEFLPNQLEPAKQQPLRRPPSGIVIRFGFSRPNPTTPMTLI